MKITIEQTRPDSESSKDFTLAIDHSYSINFKFDPNEGASACLKAAARALDARTVGALELATLFARQDTL
jgi:hypothetical protein